jgi:hypothetical protein
LLQQENILKLFVKRELSAVTVMALALGMMASTPAEAKGKTKWPKCCDANGNTYKVAEGTPGAVADTGTAGAPGAKAKGRRFQVIYALVAIAGVAGIIAVASSNNKPKSA